MVQNEIFSILWCKMRFFLYVLWCKMRFFQYYGAKWDFFNSFASQHCTEEGWPLTFCGLLNQLENNFIMHLWWNKVLFTTTWTIHYEIHISLCEIRFFWPSFGLRFYTSLHLASLGFVWYKISGLISAKKMNFTLRKMDLIVFCPCCGEKYHYNLVWYYFTWLWIWSTNDTSSLKLSRLQAIQKTIWLANELELNSEHFLAPNRSYLSIKG